MKQDLQYDLPPSVSLGVLVEVACKDIVGLYQLAIVEDVFDDCTAGPQSSYVFL